MGKKAKKAKALLSAAVRGKLLFTLGADKLLPQIIYCFLLAIICIWVNLQISSAVHKVEKNKVLLENLESIYAETKCRLTALNSVCKVEEMLSGMGSSLTIPEKQAIKVKTE